MKTQLPLLFITLLFSSTGIFDQNFEPEYKIKEIGLSSASLVSYHFNYKYKPAEKNYFYRISGGYISLTSLLNKGQNSNAGLSIRVGIEKRKSLTKKMDLFYGIDYVPGFNGSFSEGRSVVNISQGIGFGTGIMYRLNKRFYFTAEVLPLLQYSIQVSSERSPVHSLRFNLFSTPVNLGIAYRF